MDGRAQPTPQASPQPCWGTCGTPGMSGAAGPKGRDQHGHWAATSLGVLVAQFPAPVPAEASGFQGTLAQASECLLTAHREIRRSMRTPISLHDTTVLSDLISKVSDLLAADNVATALGRPVSGLELADAGYRLLDIASEYNVLAQHFYSEEVQGARARRTSDAAEAEIAAVASKAASLKLGVLTFLTKVAEALQKTAPPLN
jgi:hypothetical protein